MGADRKIWEKPRSGNEDDYGQTSKDRCSGSKDRRSRSKDTRSGSKDRRSGWKDRRNVGTTQLVGSQFDDDLFEESKRYLSRRTKRIGTLDLSRGYIGKYPWSGRVP